MKELMTTEMTPAEMNLQRKKAPVVCPAPNTPAEPLRDTDCEAARLLSGHPDCDQLPGLVFIF